MPKETVGQSKTLFWGISILKACSGSRSGLILAEIAGINALAPSTVHRLLVTLEGLANRCFRVLDGQRLHALQRLCCADQAAYD